MKKLLIAVVAFMATTMTAEKARAQKIGVFDIDIMVQAMPGYRTVDSLVGLYEQDSLRGDYEFAVREYNRLDSTYKADSAARKPASVLNYVKDQRTQFATTLIYWQQIAQQRSEGKRQELAGPMYEKVLTAYDKVLKANSYLVILKPGAYEIGSKVENVFEKVAKELKITLPEQLRSQNAPAEEARPATGTKPAPKKQ